MVLARALHFVCCRCCWLLSQQPPSRFVSTAASLLFDSTASFAANRPGFSPAWLTVHLFCCTSYCSMCCCSSSDILTVCTLFFNLANLSSSVAFPRHLLYRSKTSHRCDSLRLCADVVFTLIASVAVDTSSVMDVYLYSSRSSPSRAFLLRVRVSNFVFFCSLGFLACGLVGLDLLHLAHTVESLSCCWCFWCSWESIPFTTLPNSLCASTAFCAATSVVGLDCVLTSVLVHLVIVSVLCCLLDLSIILDWRKNVCPARNVKPVLELFD